MVVRFGRFYERRQSDGVTGRLQLALDPPPFGGQIQQWNENKKYSYSETVNTSPVWAIRGPDDGSSLEELELMLGLKRFGRLFFLAFYVVAAWFLCSLLLQYFRSQIAGEYTNWNFDAERYEEEILYSTDRCATVKRLFRFNEEPLSSEEAAYPLAYGMIVYKDIVQVLLMLSSFYHPQNEYCLAVSGSSKPFFSIWPRIFPDQRGRIFWGSFEIINATYGCMEMLTKKKSNWQYFQYLSGVDAPPQDKPRNGSDFQSDERHFQLGDKVFPKGALEKEKCKMSDSPLPLFKSSLSALVPRSAAEEIVSSEKTHDLMMFLNGTGIPDEGFWSTLGANRKKFPIPGIYRRQ
ncbi:unnamed protein product [Caenorhabditis auriculariae]|uniref:Uncharacterized protein n=1 Tax=Caenorhabditis auriculariae TaxID=2777116 RepID=A0A8S1HFS7_9PELO|nr:unnamed protein product [Caenorhabditis auriculariae]